MSAANDADGRLLQADAFLLLQQQQRALNILRHRARIAARAVSPIDVSTLHVVCVDMVEADGGSSNELHLTALEQLFVAASAGAHYQRISISHIIRTNLCSWQG